jgi:hypothetical protein
MRVGARWPTASTTGRLPAARSCRLSRHRSPGGIPRFAVMIGFSVGRMLNHRVTAEWREGS